MTSRHGQRNPTTHSHHHQVSAVNPVANRHYNNNHNHNRNNEQSRASPVSLSVPPGEILDLTTISTAPNLLLRPAPISIRTVSDISSTPLLRADIMEEEYDNEYEAEEVVEHASVEVDDDGEEDHNYEGQQGGVGEPGLEQHQQPEAVVPVQQPPPAPTMESASEAKAVSPELRGYDRKRLARHVGRTLRSVARLAALHQSQHEQQQQRRSQRMTMLGYDATDHVLQDLELVEQWTDEFDAVRYQVAILCPDGLDILFNLFVVFSKQPVVLFRLCNILTYLARNAMVCQVLAAHGAIAAICKAMKRHKHIPELQARACNALNNLAMRSDHRHLIAQAGGIPLVHQAMALHPLHPEVQANGCNCLWNLAILPENRPLVAGATWRGIFLILKAMKEHVQNPSLFGEGCGCLWNLADYAPARSQILYAGGIHVIIHAMERHPREAVMHRLCLGALESLLNDNDVGRVLLWRAQTAAATATQGGGGIVTVLQSMSSWTDDEEMQSAGCGIVSSLACGDLMNLAVDNFGASLLKHGASELVLQAMERHGSSAKVQARACSALLYLAYDPTARLYFANIPVVPLVERALFAHSTDTTVFGTALMALSQLTTTTSTTTRDMDADTETRQISLSSLLLLEDRAKAA